MSKPTKIYFVPPGGNQFSREAFSHEYSWLKAHPKDRNDIIKKLPIGWTFLCGCLEDTGEPLLPLGLRNAAGNSHPVCKPGQAVKHSPECSRNRRVAQKTPTVTTPAIEVAADGNLVVRLRGGLRRRPPDREERTRDTAPPERKESERKRTNSMTGLGLLEMLWSKSGLNVFDPKSPHRVRDYRGMLEQLKPVVDTIAVGKASCTDRIFVAPVGSADPKGAELTNRLGQLRRNEVLAVVGEYYRHTAKGPGDHEIRMTSYPGTPLVAEAKVFAAAEKSYGALKSSPTRRTIVILECYLAADGTIRVERLAWLKTQRRYLPYSSEFEARAIDKAVHEKRHFRKPLNCERGQNGFLHDFIFYDVEGFKEYPGEIWHGWGGVLDENCQDRAHSTAAAYEEQRRAKIDHCRGDLWEWDAKANPLDIPDFPPRASAPG